MNTHNYDQLLTDNPYPLFPYYVLHGETSDDSFALKIPHQPRITDSLTARLDTRLMRHGFKTSHIVEIRHYEASDYLHSIEKVRRCNIHEQAYDGLEAQCLGKWLIAKCNNFIDSSIAYRYSVGISKVHLVVPIEPEPITIVFPIQKNFQKVIVLRGRNKTEVPIKMTHNMQISMSQCAALAITPSSNPDKTKFVDVLMAELRPQIPMLKSIL